MTSCENQQLRQVLENKSEGVLIRKWFDRWYVTESLCDRLCGKIDHDLISQQHESWCGKRTLHVRGICTISTRMDLSLHVKWWVFTRILSAVHRKQLNARRSQHGVVFCSQILFSSATVAFETNFLSLADFNSDLSWTNCPLVRLGP